jgi:serine/threonine-protein kinase
MQREAQVTSRLSHPNIVEVIDFNHTEEGTPFLVMELLDGRTLAEHLQQVGELSLAQVASVARQVCSALRAAHDEGIVHRDLKPSNIFLCREKRDGPDELRVKVVDFGLSKVLVGTAPRDASQGPRLTQAMAVMGSPRYLAPEQALGRSAEADIRSDVFSVGAVLCRVIGGEAPFSGLTVDDTLQQVVHGLPSEGPRWARVPPPIREVVLRALSKDPEARQQTMRALWRQLRGAMQEAGIIAEPSSMAGGRPAMDAPPSPSATPSRLWMLTAVIFAASCLLLLLLLLWPSPEPRATAPGRVAGGRPAADTGAPPPGAPAPRAVAPSSLAAATSQPRDAAVARVTLRSRKAVTHVKLRKRPPRRLPRRPVVSRPAIAPQVEQGGSLLVQTKAGGDYLWADVWVDSEFKGRTTLIVRDLSPGPHQLQVRRHGYLPVSRVVSVVSNKRKIVRIELSPTAEPPR